MQAPPQPSKASTFALAALLVAVAVTALPAARADGPQAVHLRVYDASGTTLLDHVADVVPAAEHAYFAVATAGFNDPGSGEGRVAIDDLTVTRSDGSQQQYAFSTDPGILESGSGGAAQALRHDAANGRLLAVADSGTSCTSNYQAIAVASAPAHATRVRFTFTRLTGDVGDGSFWDLAIGLAPGLDAPVQGATCAADQRTGSVPALVGLHYAGDGDGVRNAVRAWAAGAEVGSPFQPAIGTAYVADISFAPATLPGAPSIPGVAAGEAAGEAVVSWTRPNDGGAQLHGYNLYSSTNGAAYTLLAELGDVQSYTVTGLPAGAPRWFKVQAVNGVGAGPLSPGRGGYPPDPAGWPEGVQARPGRTLQERVLTWSDPASGAAHLGFNVYARLGSDLQLVATVPAATHSYTSPHWAPLYVSAFNSIGESYRVPAELVGFNDVYADAPNYVEARAVASPYHEVRVDWDAPCCPPSSPTGYRVYRASSPDGPWSLAHSAAASERSATFSLGDAGVKAYLKVTARYGTLESLASKIASATSMDPSYCQANPACTVLGNQPPEVQANTWTLRRYVGLGGGPSAVASDPQENPVNDEVSVTIDWGDGIQDSCEWAATSSTVGCSPWHVWRFPGSFEVWARAQDSNGALSAWARVGTVNVEERLRAPPPQGPSALNAGAAGSFSVVAGEGLGLVLPGQAIAFTVDWGDGSTGTASSTTGVPVGLEHAWPSAGLFCVKATPTGGIQSGPPTQQPSGCHWVRVNGAPPRPAAPDGPGAAAVGVAATYAVAGSDGEGDPLSLLVDWGDGSTSTVAARPGRAVTASHAWDAAGPHCVRVRAADAHGAASPWSACRTVTAS